MWFREESKQEKSLRQNSYLVGQSQVWNVVGRYLNFIASEAGQEAVC